MMVIIFPSRSTDLLAQSTRECEIHIDNFVIFAAMMISGRSRILNDLIIDSPNFHEAAKIASRMFVLHGSDRADGSILIFTVRIIPKSM